MISREEILFTGRYTRQNSENCGKTSRVLLVEDDQALRRYLEVLLTRAGYEVLTAADGLEGMTLLLGSGEIDIVLTDAIMPNLSGKELCRFLKSTPTLCHIPIVLLSALDSEHAKDEAKGFDALLAKPVTNELLINCLDNLLSQPRFRKVAAQVGQLQTSPSSLS